MHSVPFVFGAQDIYLRDSGYKATPKAQLIYADKSFPNKKYHRFEFDHPACDKIYVHHIDLLDSITCSVTLDDPNPEAFETIFRSVRLSVGELTLFEASGKALVALAMLRKEWRWRMSKGKRWTALIPIFSLLCSIFPVTNNMLIKPVVFDFETTAAATLEFQIIHLQLYNPIWRPELKQIWPWIESRRRKIDNYPITIPNPGHAVSLIVIFDQIVDFDCFVVGETGKAQLWSFAEARQTWPEQHFRPWFLIHISQTTDVLLSIRGLSKPADVELVLCTTKWFIQKHGIIALYNHKGQ